MDEEPESDHDITVRQQSLDAAIWFLESASPSWIIQDPQEVISIAAQFEHYLTNGGTIEFHCTDKLRPTVRGGI